MLLYKFDRTSSYCICYSISSKVLSVYSQSVSNSIMALSKIVLAIDLGGNRHLHVHEDNEVFIKDLVSTKCAFFTASRWKRFVCFPISTDMFNSHQLVKRRNIVNTSVVRGMFLSTVRIRM